MPAQLARIGGLAHQVELVDDRGFKLAHDLDRFNAFGFAPVAIGHLRQQQQHFNVFANLCLDAGAYNFHNYLLAIVQLCCIDLRN